VTSPTASPENVAPTSGLSDYLDAVRRRWYFLVIGPVVALLVAVGITQLQNPVYVGRAEMLAQPGSGSLFSPSADGSKVQSAQELATQLQLMRSALVRAQVAERLGIGVGQVPPLAASQIGQTLVVAVQVESSDPELAAVAANAYVEVFIDSRRTAAIDDLAAAGAELQTQITALQVQIDEIDVQIAAAPAAEGRDQAAQRAGARNGLEAQQALYRERIDKLQVDSAVQEGGGQMVTPAFTPGNPVSPTPVRNAGIALVAGLMVGLALALLVDHLDDSLRNDDDLRLLAPEVPLLATVPSVKVDGRGPITIDHPGSPAAEAFRGLRTSVQFLGIDRPLKVIEVTSTGAGEGKTTTASNLAVVLARAGQRVCLVDCDLRRPRQHVVFGVPLEPGFTSVVMGSATLQESLRAVPGEDRLYLLPAGPPPPNPSELLSSSRVKPVFDALSADGACDVIIVDAPPVLPITDAVVLAGRVDALLVVVAASQSRRHHVKKALQTLGLVSAPVVGFVLNKAKTSSRIGKGYQGYGYNGYGGYDAEPTRADR